MKLIFKILKLVAVLIIAVSILLFSASMLLQNKVGDIVLQSLNNNISTKLDVGSFKLSFLRKFPNASLELKNVLVLSSSNFNSDLFTGINTDTLLAARFVSVEFKITDILNGVYLIESIGARAGKVNLFTDTTGQVNYDISAKRDGEGKDDFTIDLKRINLTDIKTRYYNLATRLSLNGNIDNGRMKSRISGKDIDFTAGAEIQIDSLRLNDIRIVQPFATDINVSLERSANGVIFQKGTLQIENYHFGLSGSVSSDRYTDLYVTGNNIDISKIRNYLPEKYSVLVSEYDPSGTLIIDCKIKGLLSRTSNPHIEINCLLDNGHITYGKSDLTITDLSFAGYYSNGSEDYPGTRSVSVKDIKANIGSAEYSGLFLLSDFDNPIAEILLKGRIIPGELKQFFNLQKISTADGSVDLELKMPINLKHKGKYSIADIIDMKPEANRVFNSFSIGLNNNKMLFQQIDGNLSLSDSVLAKKIRLTYKGQRIKIDGVFTNLAEWLTGRPVRITASADVSFNRFIPETFIKDSSSSETLTSNKTAFSLPDDVLLDINFQIDSMNYKSISSSDIQGTLNYKPRLLTFTSLNMKSLNPKSIFNKLLRHSTISDRIL